MTYTVDSPEIAELLEAWHENGRASFERWTPNLVYDDYAPKTAKDRKKYLALDSGTGGVFLVDKATGDVWTIKGYGRPNRRICTIAELTETYRQATASGATLRR